MRTLVGRTDYVSRRRALGSVAALLGALALTLVVAGCGGGDDASGAYGDDGGTLALVAYSTPREAYEELVPMFQENDPAGDVDFEESYASSGEQR